MSDTTVAGTPAAKPPEFRCELFPLSSAVFRIERTRENGTTVLRRVSLQKRFKNQEGNWDSETVFLNAAELPAAIRVLQTVERHLLSSSGGTEPAGT